MLKSCCKEGTRRAAPLPSPPTNSSLEPCALRACASSGVARVVCFAPSCTPALRYTGRGEVVRSPHSHRRPLQPLLDLSSLGHPFPGRRLLMLFFSSFLVTGGIMAVATASTTTATPERVVDLAAVQDSGAALCTDKIPHCDVHKANGACQLEGCDKNGRCYPTQHQIHQHWRENCAKTCGFCIDTTALPTTTEGGCIDKVPHCAIHKANGGCSSANPDHHTWRSNCAKTCGYCEDPIYNGDKNCRNTMSKLCSVRAVRVEPRAGAFFRTGCRSTCSACRKPVSELTQEELLQGISGIIDLLLVPDPSTGGWTTQDQIDWNM